MILPVLGMNQDEPCTDKYIKCTAMFMHCIYHVQTRIYIPEFICSVYPRFRHYYTKTNIHVHAHRMYVLRICLLCTISLIYEHENQKVKIWSGGDSNPWPFACQSLAFTTALPVMIYISHSDSICLLFYLEVGDIRQAQDQQRPRAQPWRCRPKHQHGSLWSRGLQRIKPWRRGCGGALRPNLNWETVSDMKSGWLLLNWYRHRLNESCWISTG